MTVPMSNPSQEIIIVDRPVTILSLPCPTPNRTDFDMRELTFIETGYLCALLCLSLVLPMLMSFLGPVTRSTKQSSIKIVWLNQAIGTVCAIIVLSSAALAPYATLLALVTCA